LALMLGIAAWSVKPALRSLWGVGILSVWLHALLDYPMQQRPALAAFFFAWLGALASQTYFPFRERPSRVDNLATHHG